MSKKDLIYPAYLSEHTIQKLFNQIPQNMLGSIAVELNVDVKIFSLKLSKTPAEKELSLISQALAVVSFLRKHQPEQIGTVDEPKKYIEGTLKMFSHYLPQGFGTKENAKPELIYYGGSTEHTILGLAGATSYVNSPTQDPMTAVSSALPDLMRVLLKEFDMVSATPRFNPVKQGSRQAKREAGHALECIEYMDEYNGPPVQMLSFFAKTKLDSEQIKGWDWDKRIVLASPLYVFYAD